MALQKLRPLLEALLSTPGVKKASGEVRDAETLLASDSLALLDARHAGVYALFVLDPKADSAVVAYLESGSLANDAGADVLALHERVGGGAPARATRALDPALDVEIASEDAMVRFARALMPGQALRLPGLLFAARLAEPGDCVYVPLPGASRDEVTAGVRKALVLAGQAARRQAGETSFADALGFELARAGVANQRSGVRSLREELTRLLSVLWRHRKDLMAMVPVVGKMLGGKDDKTP